jgi:peptidyl-prolyl cis-trans isomerase B (cyclophilin B)
MARQGYPPRWPGTESTGAEPLRASAGRAPAIGTASPTYTRAEAAHHPALTGISDRGSTSVTNAKKPGTGATNKRRKELAAAKLERQSARRAEKAARRRRNQRITVTIVALAGIGLIAALLLWPDSDSAEVAEPDSTPSASADPSASPSASAEAGCDPAPTPPEEPGSWQAAPAQALEEGTEYTLTLATNCGDIVIETSAEAAPETVNSMLWLAGEGYFDSTLCHRLTTEGIFVLQCGDPTATGTGGPGYTVPDENLPADESNNYPAGTVAMANAGPGTAGSQFFVVYEDTTLPPNYTIWGTVTQGLDVVQRVAAAGVSDGGTDGSPAAPIGILSATAEPALG